MQSYRRFHMFSFHVFNTYKLMWFYVWLPYLWFPTCPYGWIMYLYIGYKTIRQNPTCNHPSIVKIPYYWRSSRVLLTWRHSRSSSANCTELILRMDVHRRRRTIPREQRRLMLMHSRETRLRLARFARRFGVSARDLRHLYVEGHMPIAMWQEFLMARIPVPQCWIKDRFEVNLDGHKPWVLSQDQTRRCLRCADLRLDPVHFVMLPPPYWQLKDPIPKFKP